MISIQLYGFNKVGPQLFLDISAYLWHKKQTAFFQDKFKSYMRLFAFHLALMLFR